MVLKDTSWLEFIRLNEKKDEYLPLAFELLVSRRSFKMGINIQKSNSFRNLFQNSQHFIFYYFTNFTKKINNKITEINKAKNSASCTNTWSNESEDSLNETKRKLEEVEEVLIDL